ncbi:MAG: hypothetical protein RL160_804 [Bacteroidota bacterium]|jgi:hypothetical protein
MKIPFTLCFLFIGAIQVQAQFSSPGLPIQAPVHKLSQERTLRSATKPTACKTDTVEYTLYKATALNSISVRKGSSLGQFFSAPQTLTVHGFRFFGWALSGTAASNYTIRVICNLYKAGTDSLPSGAPLASDTITIDTTFGGGRLAVLQKDIFFKKAVTLNYGYIIAVECDSVTNGAGVVANSWSAKNGKRENLLCGSVSGKWYRGLNLNISGVALDADMNYYPFVSYDLAADFSINNTCYPISDTVRFTNLSNKSVAGSRVYDYYTYSNLERFVHYWNTGDGTFDINSIHHKKKYTTKANYNVRLITRHIPWSAPICADTTFKTIYFKPTVPMLNGNFDACFGDSVKVSAKSDAGVKIQWFRNLSDTLPFFTGDVYTVKNLQANDTFYVMANNNGCNSAMTRGVIRMNLYPDDPSVRNDSICSGSAANLSASSNRGIVEWYRDAVSTSPFATGNVFTTGVLTADTSFFVRVNNLGCLNKGGRLKVSAFVGSQFAPKPPIASSDTSVCIRPTATITLKAKAQGPYSVRWFNQPSGGSVLKTDTLYSFKPAARGTYYYYVDAFNGICPSSRLSIAIHAGDYPDVQGVFGDTACLGDSLKPSVKLAFGTADWFASDTGTSLLFTGNTYPHLSTQTGSAFYYVAVSDDGCMAPVRTKVPVRVAQAPAITGLTSPVICSKGTALLQGNVSSGTINWYDDVLATQPIATGKTYRTPMLLGGFTYYAESVAEGCVSARIPVNVKVNPRPAAGFTWQLLWQRRVVCTPISTNGVTSFWDFGDGSTLTSNVGSHTYAANGVYTVRLVQTLVSTGCKDTADIQVVADHTGVRELQRWETAVYPNPVSAGSVLHTRLPEGIRAARIVCYDVNGKAVWNGALNGSSIQIPANIAPGWYLCSFQTAQGTYYARMVVGN